MLKGLSDVANSQPDIPTAIGCLVLTPTGKATKVAEKKKFGKKTKISKA